MINDEFENSCMESPQNNKNVSRWSNKLEIYVHKTDAIKDRINSPILLPVKTFVFYITLRFKFILCSITWKYLLNKSN